MSEAPRPRQQMVDTGDRQVTRSKQIPWASVAGIAAIVFLYLPIVMIVVFSFSEGPSTRFPIRNLTFEGYVTIVQNRVVIDAAWNSLLVAVGTMILAAVLTTPAALGLTRYRSRFATPLQSIFILPIAIPALILGIAMLTFFAAFDLPLSLWTVILGHTVFAVPFQYLIVRARLQDLDPHIREAARDLGANEWQTFWRVTFPLIRSTIFGGMILVFGISFDEFIIALFTIGPQSTLPLVIWSMLKRGIDAPSLGALMTLLLVATVVILVIASRYTKTTIED